jgi:predicted RNA-binding Zn-ribbon protein involved in translation (DUF1610 family)
MELRYCEECGDVIRAEATDPLTIADHFVCDKCHSGAKAEKGEEAATETDFDSSRLNLFSPDTVAIHKRQYEEELSSSQSKSTRLRLVKDGAPAEAEGTVAIEENESGTAPAKTAQKIVFRCLHCRSTLSIRQVDRTSRLTCPHCGKAIYVTASGRLYKSSPPPAMKKGEGLLQDRPGSQPSGGAPEAKAGSAALNIKAGATRTPAGAGSTAVKRTSAAGSTAVQRTSRAGSASLKSASSTGSVALRKVGSQATPRAQQSSRNIEGLRAQAAPSRELVEDGKPAPAQPSASATTAPEAGQPHAGPTATQVGLTRVNPLGGWTPKPPSAFEEHQASQSPEKTVFITDEPTADLSALAGSNLLASAGSFSDPAASEDKLVDLATEVKDPVSTGGDLAKDLVASEESSKETAPRRVAPFRARPQLTRRVVEGFVRAVFLTAFLCAPLFIVGGLLPPQVTAEAKASSSREGVPGFMEWLGKVATQGIQKLVSSQQP